MGNRRTKKYRALNKIFMKNSKIALIIYSITEKNSFKQLTFWINLVNDININNNVIIGNAANKSDLFENKIIKKEDSENLQMKKNAF